MYEELVKRLRERAEFLTVSDRMAAPPNVNVKNLFAEDMAQAADVIEKLAEDNKRLMKTVSSLRSKIRALKSDASWDEEIRLGQVQGMW